MDGVSHLSALAGGALIGLAATLLLWAHGKVAGVSGVLGGFLNPAASRGWRLQFVAGLLLGGAAFRLMGRTVFELGVPRSLGALAAAGLLVGFGTRLAGGCTSGHGVCGMSRLSVRSVAATATFIATGAATVLAVRLFFGGGL